jgi:5-methylcytosine-specific restriction endonuclease McrA
MEYNAYMRSDRWKAIRELMIEAAGGMCERCGKVRKRLEVHHLTYIRFGHEKPEDLQVLCAPCHIITDANRKMWARKTRRRRKIKP